MVDKTTSVILREYEEKINQQLIELIQADPLNAPIALMRANIAILMLKYTLKVTEEMEVSMKQIQQNANHMLE